MSNPVSSATCSQKNIQHSSRTRSTSWILAGSQTQYGFLSASPFRIGRINLALYLASVGIDVRLNHSKTVQDLGVLFLDTLTHGHVHRVRQFAEIYEFLVLQVVKSISHVFNALHLIQPGLFSHSNILIEKVESRGSQQNVGKLYDEPGMPSERRCAGQYRPSSAHRAFLSPVSKRMKRTAL
ncbi:hypothetical protein EVAR_2260_1 [Eumeta japonica]|uniref:Uncharacterized protein n=1 Tax=Eumeta variegata TaxID=151549 RepID=A0A4C1SG15_EUMVA|nr:hypothetical protein EVAR_2260_1 [Eumeta japonica]